MLHSMTAFARAKVTNPCLQAVWEIRSVNHRYLELSVRLPEQLRQLEPDIREIVRQRLHRGKVECSLRYDASADAGTVPLVINQNLSEQLLQACAQIERQLPNARPASALDILRWPGVLQQDESKLDEARADILNSLGAALEDLQSARAKEGTALADCIRQRLQQISQHVAHTRARGDEILALHRQRLQTKLAELQTQVEPTRLEQELLLLVQKSDIHEELDRLATHVQHISDVLDKGGTVGRRLDFLMQELNREANTLGAKAADDLTSKTSVELKVLIEQMREQIQNLE